MMESDLQALKQNKDLVRLNPELQDAPKPSKYRNIKSEYNGRVYASRREMRRAQELDLAVAAGSVATWIPQVRFTLEADIKYVADFVVLLKDGTWRAEDTKGVRTQTYRLKRRLFKKRYGQDIVEV